MYAPGHRRPGGRIVPYCRRDFIYDESLLLRGMERIYRLNCKQ